MALETERKMPGVDFIPEMATLTRIRAVFASGEALHGNVKRLKTTRAQPRAIRSGMDSRGRGGADKHFLAAHPDRDLRVCIRKIGNVTGAIHGMKENDRIGIRGPLGKGFDLDTLKGSDLVFIAGGIGLAPLRSLIKYALERRDHFKDLALLYGAKTPSERIFKDELDAWEKRKDFKTIYTVDKGEESWKGRVGLLTMFFDELNIKPATSYVILCGPPVMYKYAIIGLRRFRVPPDKVILSLERRMRCGVGKRGHCQINDKYVCKDGPKFTWAELRNLEEAL